MEPETFPSRDLKEIDWSSYVYNVKPGDTGSDLRVKKVRFCEFPAAALCSSVECSHVARGRCDCHNTVTDMFCDEHQQITID